MAYTITTLVENSVATSFGLIAEHGQSLLIEGHGRTILFDTGQGNALLNNAAKLGKDLSKVDTVIISHGHYDHTLGLGPLMSVNTGFELIIHPDAFQNKVAMMPGKSGPEFKPIGMQLTREDIEKRGVKINLVTQSYKVAPRLVTSGEIPMTNDFEQIEPILMVGNNGHKDLDLLADDLSLFMESDKGLVVILGCAHRGIVNILDHARKLTGVDSVHAIIGGLHMERAGDDRILKTIEKFQEYGIKKIGASHCTGVRAIAAMYKTLGDAMMPNFVGATVSV